MLIGFTRIGLFYKDIEFIMEKDFQKWLDFMNDDVDDGFDHKIRKMIFKQVDGESMNK
jgi:hypothetical protein